MACDNEHHYLAITVSLMHPELQPYWVHWYAEPDDCHAPGWQSINESNFISLASSSPTVWLATCTCHLVAALVDLLCSVFALQSSWLHKLQLAGLIGKSSCKSSSIHSLVLWDVMAIERTIQAVLVIHLDPCKCFLSWATQSLTAWTPLSIGIMYMYVQNPWIMPS